MAINVVVSDWDLSNVVIQWWVLPDGTHISGISGTSPEISQILLIDEGTGNVKSYDVSGVDITSSDGLTYYDSFVERNMVVTIRLLDVNDKIIVERTGIVVEEIN